MPPQCRKQVKSASYINLEADTAKKKYPRILLGDEIGFVPVLEGARLVVLQHSALVSTSRFYVPFKYYTLVTVGR